MPGDDRALTLEDVDPDEPDHEPDRDEDQRRGRDIRVDPVVGGFVRVPSRRDRERHAIEITLLGGGFLRRKVVS